MSRRFPDRLMLALLSVSLVLVCFQHREVIAAYRKMNAETDLQMQALMHQSQNANDVASRYESLVRDTIRSILGHPANKNVTEELVNAIIDVSALKGFNPLLTASIIKHESGGDIDAVSYRVNRSGGASKKVPIAYGAMQINYAVWKDTFDLKAAEQLFEVRNNISIGIDIIRHYYDREKNIARALFRYNNGYKHNNTKYVPAILETYHRHTAFYPGS